MGKLPWKSLFVKHTFFTKDYKYYIAVIAASTTKENSKIWGGFVESKIRLLVQGLERHSSIRLARPFNKGYERRHRTLSGMNEWQEILDGSLKYVVKDEEVADEKAKTEPGNDAVKPEPTSPTKINEEEGNGNADIKAVDVNDMDVTDGELKPEGEDADGPKDIYTSTHYIGIELHDGAKQLDLSYEVNEFKNLLFAWDKYAKELHDFCSISVQHVRNFALPDDVFAPGETKPTRPLKKKGAQPPNGAKRKSPAEGALNSAIDAAKRQKTSTVSAG
ncbi:polynucleotide adenylyltransferase [Cytospora paraplurivora]